MKLIIVSTFWNTGKLVSDCINSLKNQYYTNFTAYFIDDMSSDNSYDIAKNTIGNDERFVLIKNTEKKYKTKNFIDVIRNNPRIDWNDVIIEIDGDDKLADNFVLGRINKVFTDENIWLCGTKWKDNYGRVGNYGKPNVERPRQTSWNFSHMRSYRAFLFRQIQDEHLKYNGEYFKAACDIGIAIPMMEMSGEQHFHYINEPLYIYSWHNRQSYSDNNSFGDKTLQGKTASYIYNKLPKYGKLVLNGAITTSSDYIEPIVELIPKKDISSSILVHPKTIDYNKINEILGNKPDQKVQPNQKPEKIQTPQNKPISRNVVNDNKNLQRHNLAKLSIKKK